MANTSAPINDLPLQKSLAFHTEWSAAERRFVILVIAIVLAVTSLPFLFGYLTTPPDKQFMGIMLDVPDHAQYFSWMRELATQNLASNKMTPEANRPLFFNLLWWGLGRAGSLLGLDYAVMFQVLRVGATILFLLLVYRMCCWFFSNPAMRKTAFLLVTFTSGWGWVLVLLKYLTGKELLFPLDVYIAEGNTFLGILGYPHFIAAALYIFCFDLLLRGQSKQQLRYAVWAGLVALFLGWQHAYDLVSVYAVLLAYAILQWLRDRKLPVYMIKSGLIVGGISVWPAIYSVLLTSMDPIWKDVLKQFANAGVYTPNLLHLPILFGFTFLLAVYATVRMNPLRLNTLDDNRLFLVGWFLVTFLIIYLPVDYQIHLLNGWQVPMAFLAVFGMQDYILPWVERLLLKRQSITTEQVRRLAVALVIALVIPTNLYLFAWRFLDLSRHDYPYYLYQDELQAMAWLDENSRPDDVIFSSLTTGQYVPMLTGSHAYLAHWAQTLDFYAKSQAVEDFFSPGLDASSKKQILAEGNVAFVFFGPAEKALGSDRLDGIYGLAPVYENSKVTIYRFTR